MVTRPFLGGEPVSFHEAFPNIGEFRITIEQDHWDFHGLKPYMKKLTYTPKNPPPETIQCVNPRCQQGGLLMRNYIYTADTRKSAWQFEDILSCNGHEGSPKGRHIGRRCDVAWKVIMDFASPTSD